MGIRGPGDLNIKFMLSHQYAIVITSLGNGCHSYSPVLGGTSSIRNKRTLQEKQWVCLWYCQQTYCRWKADAGDRLFSFSSFP